MKRYTASELGLCPYKLARRYRNNIGKEPKKVCNVRMYSIIELTAINAYPFWSALDSLLIGLSCKDIITFNGETYREYIKPNLININGKDYMKEEGA